MSLRGALSGRVKNVGDVPIGSRYANNLTLGTAVRTPWNDQQLMATMGSVGTLFGIVERITTGTSLPEWKLWRKTASGKKEDRKEVVKHAALDLWNKPNPFQHRQGFVETFSQHVELVGESSWIVGYASGFSAPLELWAVRPDRIQVVPDPYKFIKGYVYTSPDGEQVPLAMNEVIQIKRPNPLDPYRGMGPVQSLLADLDSVKYGKEWQRNFFLNSAEPGGIIQVEKRLSDDEFDEMSLRWDEQHKGVSKAHRIAIIEQGTWVSNKFSQRDMQFAELTDISDNQLMKAFGFPRPMLGITENVNRANADAAEYLFAKWLTLPRLERIKGVLNYVLLPLFGQGTINNLEFDYESPVAEDSQSQNEALTARGNFAVAMTGAGFDATAVLEAADLPDIPYEKPEPPVVAAPFGADPNDDPKQDPAQQDGLDEKAKKDLEEKMKNFTDKFFNDLDDIMLAQRWESIAHLDDNTCDPCKENNGKLYKNREDAYADYPGGKGFKDCVGAEFGNKCRCSVVKRKKDK